MLDPGFTKRGGGHPGNREDGEFIGPFRASCLDLGRGLDPSLFLYLCHEKSMPMGSFSLSLVLAGIWAIAVAAFFRYILL